MAIGNGRHAKPIGDVYHEDVGTAKAENILASAGWCSVTDITAVPEKNRVAQPQGTAGSPMWAKPFNNLC